MRLADNFNPEWGYLAPAPSFMRTARVALVAAAVGAISGAGVVLSLIDRPAAEETSVAARTLVRQPDLASVATLPTGQLQRSHEISTTTDHVANSLPRVAESDPVRSVPHSSAAALMPAVAAAAAPTPAINETAMAAETPSLQKRAIKRRPLPQQRLTWRAPEPAFGGHGTPLALLPNSNNSMRGQYSGAYQARNDF